MDFHCTDALVTLASVEMGQLVLFYTQLLQQEPVAYRPNVYAEFHLPGLRLGIFSPKEEHRPDDNANGGMSLCLEVTDLEGAIAHLTAIGYPPPGEILTASHGREIYAYDPAGNRLILHQSYIVSEKCLIHI